ncbi:hypothetical protein F2Q68_00001381 [Brassica cretica]|uniref:TIR domain-containing protein n=1 Tax=Brassica cretica TaxID=69181 RepID=A0A8S9JHP8_BRACR|nr:hypothetical protein F2Q68_00001381 [Brassica cretica]
MGLVFNEKRNESIFIHEIVKLVQRTLTSLGVRNPDSSADCDSVGSLQEEKKQENVSESESSTDPKHQVFINFRGAQLRYNFASYLVDALERHGVSFFVDANQSKGEKLEKNFNRIEESKIALVVFSTGYTESAWCLQELVKINELMDEGKLVAIPIFYKVEPSQVKNLTGVFGESFWNLWRIQRDSHIIKWKESLRSIASKLGFNLSDHGGNESEFITRIVEEVLHLLSQRQGENPSLVPSTKKPKLTESPTTAEKHETYHNVGMEQLEEKLEFDSNDTRIIGIAGMPGIGKTTLAMMLHAKWNRKFLRCVPFLDIRNKSEEHGPVWLRTTLLELLLECKIGDEITHGSVKAELRKTKFFALLDDVSDKAQLEFLLGELDWIKKGSKIIITTRDNSENDFLIRLVNSIKEVEAIILKEREGSSSSEPIIKHVMGTSSSLPPCEKEQRLEQLEQRFGLDDKVTQILGIVGMAGIGKTTLAQKHFDTCNKLSVKKIILGIHEKSKNEEGSSNWLEKEVEDEIFKNRCFILLDDVSEKSQIEYLLGNLSRIKQGSKIVITTRDKSWIRRVVHDTYVVPGLNDNEALQLFSRHAFGNQAYTPTKKGLSKKFVDYAGGNPRALEELGKELCEAARVIGDLADKFMISVSAGQIEMPQILCSLGKELGLLPSVEDNMGKSRLWDHDTVVETLVNQKFMKLVLGRQAQGQMVLNKVNLNLMRE